MDKHQATTFIVQRLHAGQPQEEIVASLARRMNAPREVAARLVEEVVAGYSTPPFEPEVQMDTAALQKFIIAQADSFSHSEDLILEVCRRSGWKWSQAETFIQQVRRREARKRALIRWLLLVPLGLVLLLAGIGLIVLTLQTAIGQQAFPALPPTSWLRLLGGLCLVLPGIFFLRQAAKTPR